ncbi:MAG: alpha/beta hydrolase [Bacteroidetes bacterium HGW-Bacteroidetes-2]|jgi:pimeloyl-ACP methyl ester carboxylesterase|nr:MAG: alpha/beta hydrolase [Bacteroidetes bacterium HGW-Bacteroidetes-2]
MIFKFKESKIFYTIQGSGNAVVLLHGFLENASMWDFFLPTLIKNHLVITIDLLGHGKTDSLGYVHTMELMAEMVQEIISKEKINKATFIGHSMGGYVALAFAEKYPERMNALVLLNSTSEADSTEKKENRDRAIQLVKQNKKGFLSMAISNLFAEQNRLIYKKEIHQLKKEALEFPIQGIVATLEGMKIRKDRTSILKNLLIPKYIITGIQDPIMPFLQQKKLTKKCGCSFIELSGGHMSTIENKEEMLNFVHFIE